ncbi:MAG: hypothetical protein KKA60_03815 [Proteobacteria bacterium]|nr:hypothetical protein [Pseudomonadota bacterium]
MNAYAIHVTADPAPDLSQAVEIFSAAWNAAPGLWLVRTSLNAAQVRDAVKTHLGPEDRLLVLGVSGEAAWRGFSEEASQRLREML